MPPLPLGPAPLLCGCPLPGLFNNAKRFDAPKLKPGDTGCVLGGGRLGEYGELVLAFPTEAAPLVDPDAADTGRVM